MSEEKSMTVSEVFQHKRDLQKEIRQLIIAFNEKTNTRVTKVDVNYTEIKSMLGHDYIIAVYADAAIVNP